MEVSVQERFTSTGVGQSTEDLALPMALNSDGDSLQQPNIRRGVWSQILLMSLFAALLYGSKGFAGTAKVAMKKDHFGSHQEAAEQCAYWNSAGLIVSFLLASFWGVFSDSFGRRGTLALYLVPFALSRGVLAFWGAAGIPVYLFLDNILVLGAGKPVMIAFVADLTWSSDEHVKSAALGVLAGTCTLSEAIFGILGAAFQKFGWSNQTICFIATCGFLSCLLALCRVKESLSAESRKTWSCGLWASPVGSVQLLWVYHVPLGCLFIAFAVSQAVTVGEDDIIDQYVSWRFGLHDLSLAAFDYTSNVIGALAAAFLTPLLVLRLGAAASAIVGLLVVVAATLIFAFAPAMEAGYPWVSCAVVLLGIGQVYVPAVMTLILQGVDSGQQGALQGALGALQTLIGWSMPLLFAWSFKESKDGFAGTPYLIGASCQGFCILMMLVHVTNRRTARRAQDVLGHSWSKDHLTN